MPVEKVHIETANRFQATLEHLLCEEEKCLEWIAVVAFYKALHSAEAVSDAQKLARSNSHQDREHQLKSTHTVSNLWKHHRPLCSASQIARYLSGRGGSSYKSFSDYMAASDVRSLLLGHQLKQFEKSTAKFLKHGDRLVQVSVQ